MLYIFSVCCFDTRFTSISKALVRFVDDNDTGIFPGILRNDIQRVIGAAVVDDNDFDIFQGLIDNRIEAFFEMFLYIVNRYDDRYTGLHRTMRFYIRIFPLRI